MARAEGRLRAGARGLCAVARRTGAVLHVGHVERFNGAVQELKKIVERPLLVESRRLGPFEPRVQKDTVVMDLMIHDLDIVLGLIDSPPRRLTAMGSTVHSGSVDVANVQIGFESGTIAIITASRATEEKIRTLAVTQPDAYIVLDYAEQDIRVHRRAAQEYTLNRESIRYRRASFVEHVQVHKDNPLKLEILHLARAVKRARAGESALLAQDEDVRSLAMALEIERMIRDGRCEVGARRADATFVGMAARAGALTEVRMLDVIVTKLAEVDIALLDQRGFLGDGLATAGCWSSRQPTAEERREVERGLSLARQAAEARIGQTVVLRRGAVTAVEALEGTTEAIRRGAALAGPGAVIVKAVARDHDYRFDTPVIGPESLEAAAAGRASVVAVEAGRVLIVDREACVRHADLAGIAFVGVEDAG